MLELWVLLLLLACTFLSAQPPNIIVIVVDDLGQFQCKFSLAVTADT